MRGWMMVAALSLPLVALAQNDASSSSSGGPTAVPADSSTAASAAAPAGDSTAAATTAAATTAAAPAPAASGDGFGSQSRLWLATQISGASSVTEERPMRGEVATLVYQRYLNSFTRAIPEHFSSESFAANGTGGGSTP